MLSKISDKQNKGKILTRRDLLQAVLTPLMAGNLSVKERILNTCRILRQETAHLRKDDLDQLQAVMYAFAVKFLNQKDLDEVKEALQMTILGEMIWNDGFQDGKVQQLISLICKKLMRGQDVNQIADAVEEDVSYVENICETARKYAPDYDAEKIFKEIQRKAK